MKTEVVSIAVFMVISFLVITVKLSSASLVYYYVDIANVDPDIQRNLTHTITFSGRLNITIPSGFNLTSYTGSPIISGNNVFWNYTSLTTINYVLSSPLNCTEGKTYDSYIYINNSYVDKFRYLCIRDSSIVSLKFENGHGESAWIDEPYFTYPFTVYTIIRVFEHQNYFNDIGKNARINCTVPNDLFVSGKFTSTCYNDTCNISKTWEELDTQLFRVFVFAQKTNYSIGSKYWVNCSYVTWNFTHEGIKAYLGNHYLESRKKEPFTILSSYSNEKVTFIITNTEKYTVYDAFLTFKINDKIKTRKIVEIKPSETNKFTFYVKGNGIVYLNIDFIPSWEYNSLSPVHYQQTANQSFYVDATAGDFLDEFESLKETIEENTDDVKTTVKEQTQKTKDFITGVTTFATSGVAKGLLWVIFIIFLSTAIVIARKYYWSKKEFEEEWEVIE